MLLLGRAAGFRLLPADAVWSGVAVVGLPQFLYASADVKPSAAALWTTAGCGAAVVLLLVACRGRWRAGLAWVVVALTTLLVWTDTVYFRFFEDLPTASALREAHQLAELGPAIRDLAEGPDAWLLLGLLGGAILGVIGTRRASLPARRPSRWVVLALVAIGFAGLVIGGWSSRSQATSGPRNLFRVVERQGLYSFHAVDLARRVLRGRIGLARATEAERASLLEWFRTTAPARAGAGPSLGAAEGANLLLIQVESMQAFVLGARVGGQELTPNLNRLAPRALNFEAFYDQTNKGRSSAGDFIYQVSLLPVIDSVAYEYPTNHYLGMAGALAARGYTTLSAIPFRGSFWNRRVTHRLYGFNSNLFRETFAPDVRVGWGLNDRAFLHQMLPHLESLPEPFCAWLTTLSLHYPYRSFPEELRHLELGPLEDTPVGNYYHAMHYFDRAFGEFWQDLERSGLLSRTVIALWGDHGSGLARDPIAARLLGLDANPLSRRLFDRVPFIVWLPGDAAPNGIVTRAAAQLDAAPTLLALLGVDPAALAYQGRNLMSPASSPRVVFADGDWLTPELVRTNRRQCWDAVTRQPRAWAACEPGERYARRFIEVAEATQRFDLQAELSAELHRLVPPPGQLPR